MALYRAVESWNGASGSGGTWQAVDAASGRPACFLGSCRAELVELCAEEGLDKPDHPIAMLWWQVPGFAAWETVVLSAITPRECTVVLEAVSRVLARLLPAADWTLELDQVVGARFTYEGFSYRDQVHGDWYNEAVEAFRYLDVAGTDPVRLEELRLQLWKEGSVLLAWTVRDSVESVATVEALSQAGGDVRGVLAGALERLMTWLADVRSDREDWAALRWAAHARLVREDLAQPTAAELSRLMNMARLF